MGNPPRRILVAYDGSEASQRALDRAADLAGYGSALTVVTVVGRREDDRIDGALDPEPLGHGERLLAEARERLLRRHLTARYLVPIGDPAEKLVGAAGADAADLIVIGRRNGNGLERLVLGSVSATVVRKAPCDVLVVR